MTPLDLLKLNVNEHTEKKQNLTYLSWAWAWAEALKADPAALWRVDSFDGPDGITRCWMDVNGTAMVWVTVTMFGKQMTCPLPVMDYKNKPIQNPDAFQLNTAIMRCMTKALALHGLGLYIYAGEDLPIEDEAEKPVKPVEKPAEKKAEKESDRANAELFADGMIEYVKVCKTTAGLSSYWKANQENVDDLKVNHPDLYERVKSVFTATKAQLKGE